jgi:quaternary ammonium compound-resistance protein SugE
LNPDGIGLAWPYISSPSGTTSAQLGRHRGRPRQEEIVTMAWVLLVAAGTLEIGWAIGLKYADGFTRLWPSVWTIVAMVLSMYLLALAARTLPIGTAYAVWVGIGAAGAMLFGMMLLGEPRSAGRIVCVGLIVAGVVGLKLLDPA